MNATRVDASFRFCGEARARRLGVMRYYSLAVFLFLVSGFFVLRSDEPAPVVPAAVSVPNVFQYMAPAGWQVTDIPNGQYPAAMEKKDGDIKGLITVNMDTSDKPLDEWCKDSLAKNTRVFADYSPMFTGLKPFATASGVTGFSSFLQLNAGGKKLHFIYYFFAGSNNARFAVTCTCAAADADHYDPLFEKAAKTFAAY
jgi:hypothetical protein